MFITPAVHIHALYSAAEIDTVVSIHIQVVKRMFVECSPAFFIGTDLHLRVHVCMYVCGITFAISIPKGLLK